MNTTGARVRYIKDINEVNLFEDPPIRPHIVCNTGWWRRNYLEPFIDTSRSSTGDYRPRMRIMLDEELIQSLRSTAGGYPSYIQHLLKYLYQSKFAEPAGKGFIRRLMGSGYVEHWQWNIFEEIEWRVSNGAPLYEVIAELKARACQVLEYEDVNTSRWRKNPEVEIAWRKLRAEAIEVYGGECAACGRSKQFEGVTMHLDHIIPKSHKPELALNFANLQLLCEDCNMGKSNKYSTDWRASARNIKPRKIRGWSRSEG